MLDWKSGDKLVAVKDGRGADCNCPICLSIPDEPLVIGRTYICKEIVFAPGSASECPEKCGSDLIVVIEGQSSEGWGYCSCCFRKPIDFSHLLNTTTLIEDKELLDA